MHQPRIRPDAARPTWPRHRASRRQRGATGVAMLLMLLAMLGMLGLIEIGYLYWAKRDTQKVADLAALAGAQQLSACTPGNAGNTAASGNARTENGFTQTLTVTCGTWDPVANAGISDHFSTAASGVSPNAVKVVAQRPVLPIWGLAGALPDVTAEAVASGLAPTAVFSIGSTLVSVSGQSPLGQLLSAAGLNIPDASLVGYNGLANVTITPSGLLNQLGVQIPANISAGGLNDLLASSVQAHALIDVLNAVVNAANQQQLLQANATLLNTLTTTLGAAPGNVTLGSNSTTSGLFAQITGPNGAAQAALNAQVNALQLISTAVAVATGQHALTLNAGAVTIPGLSVSAASSVIEPPSIGVGGVGTTASTAQVRAFINLQLSTNNVPLIGTLLSSVAKTSISLNLPMAIDLVNATATLQSLCTESAPPYHATFNVTSSVLKVCAGGITQASAFSTAGTCDKIPTSASVGPMLSVIVGGATIASVGNPFVITGLSASGSGTLAVGQSQNIPANGTPLDIGSTVSNVFTALTAGLLTQATASSGSSGSSMSSALANDLWNNNPQSNYAKQLNSALAQLGSSGNLLQSFLASTTNNLGGVLGNALTLNVSGLLTNVGGLLGGVGSALNGIVSQTLCTVTMIQPACIAAIQNAMSGGSAAQPNSLIAVLGFVLQTLQQPLDDVGSKVLTPILTHILGINLGVSTVNLQSLQCHGVQLVY